MVCRQDFFLNSNLSQNGMKLRCKFTSFTTDSTGCAIISWYPNQIVFSVICVSPIVYISKIWCNQNASAQIAEFKKTDSNSEVVSETLNVLMLIASEH